MSNPRKIALSALLKVNNYDGYSNLVLDSELKSHKDASCKDISLASALFYGVLERKITLDYFISKFIDKPFSKIPPLSLECLRLALYQIKYMDKIPESAAVNETVKLVKKSKEHHTSGFVNAVLRAALRKQGLDVPNGDSVNDLSIRYSCPEWLVNSFINDYGKDDTRSFLQDSLKVPPIYIKVNSILTNENQLISDFNNLGITAEKTNLPDALKLSHINNIENNPLFKKGHFHVQDLASQICTFALDVKEGQRVLDLCAAPGGKSFSIAQHMNDSGEVISCDLHEHRVHLIKLGANRLKVSNITALVNDATIYNPELGEFDRVLCDVPCSGFGIIRRKPDIKYKKEDSLNDLCNIQLSILENGLKYLKHGGRLIYSTCTLRKAENEEICTKFLKEYANTVEYGNITVNGIVNNNYINLFPHRNDSDGFFIAAFRKK